MMGMSRNKRVAEAAQSYGLEKYNKGRRESQSWRSSERAQATWRVCFVARSWFIGLSFVSLESALIGISSPVSKSFILEQLHVGFPSCSPLRPRVFFTVLAKRCCWP